MGNFPRIAFVIVNYRTPSLVLDCLVSLEAEARETGCTAVVVDNASGDGSADRLEADIAARGWTGWARVIRSTVNGGFSFGNNLGIRATEAEAYFLLNSDAGALPGATARLWRELEEHPTVGLVGPRLEWPDGTPQISAFRQPTPVTEFLRAARTGPIDRLLRRHVTAIPLEANPREADWVSFAAVMIRREVIEQAGLLDEGYFMFFEDVDYCRRARRLSWGVRYCPEARVVHLRGGTSPVKSLAASQQRLPRYYYAARARYHAKFYGRTGLSLSNGLWIAGRLVSRARELLEKRPTHVAERQALDNWTNWLDPMRRPTIVEERATDV